MKELSAYDVSALVKESQFLLDSKIDNVYQLEQKDLFLQIYVKEKPKQLLRIIAGKCFYLSSFRPQFPENQQRFCSYLRKYVLNARIRSFEQVGHERIIKINLETKETTFLLFVELFGKGNIILTRDEKIICVAEEQLWADRAVKPGIKYVYPQKTDSDALFEKQKATSQATTMATLDAEYTQLLQKSSKKTTAYDKEIKKLSVIIEKQSDQLQKALRESEDNKRKGELINEHYQELEAMVKLCAENARLPAEELRKKLQKYSFFKEYNAKDKTIVVGFE